MLCYVSLTLLLCLFILLAFRGEKEILSSTKLNIVHEYKVFLPTKQRLPFIQCKWKIVTKFYRSWIWKALAYLWGLSKSMMCLHGFSFSLNHFFFFWDRQVWDLPGSKSEWKQECTDPWTQALDKQTNKRAKRHYWNIIWISDAPLPGAHGPFFLGFLVWSFWGKAQFSTFYGLICQLRIT